MIIRRPAPVSTGAFLCLNGLSGFLSGQFLDILTYLTIINVSLTK